MNLRQLHAANSSPTSLLILAMENIHNHENITEIRCTANSPDFTYSVGAKIYTDSGQIDK